MKVLLALDSDEAGQRATLKNVARIADFVTSWGIPRSTGPTSQALAVAQQARDTAQARWVAFDRLAERCPTPTVLDALERAHLDLEVIGGHIADLYSQLLSDRDYVKCLSAEEWEEHEAPHKVVEDVRQLDFKAIKERADLVAFVSQYTDLVQRGSNWKGKCPLSTHDEKTPSFWVYPENHNWYCYGCSTWGDIFDLARDKGVPRHELKDW